VSFLSREESAIGVRRSVSCGHTRFKVAHAFWVIRFVARSICPERRTVLRNLMQKNHFPSGRGWSGKKVSGWTRPTAR